MSDIAELSAAMAKAFAQIGNATKGNEAKAGQYSYKYADLATVLAVIKPHLTEHGLWFTQRTTSSESSVTVETVIHHAGGAMLECGALTLPVLKRDPQGYGSAISYCRRYSLLCAFGVATEDDDGKDAGDTKGNKDAGKDREDPESAQILAALQESAKGGLEALQAKFRTLPGGAAKKRVWDEHGEKLKEAAVKAVATA